MGDYLEYPKWVTVPGEGDPLQPGHVLCETADDEAALTPVLSPAVRKTAKD